MNRQLRNILIAAITVLSLTAAPAVATEPGTVGGMTKDAALAAGERMYREGILPSGEPMTAYVQEDIPVDGTMFTCQNCHLRSGLGTAEGTIITLPTNGSKIYRTLHRGAEIEVSPSRTQLAEPFQSVAIRPAYNRETLAQAIWRGTTPNGREMDWTMPRYELDPADMEVMVFYLENLSKELSVGLSEEKLRFATVVTEEVPEDQKQAMLLTLQAYIRDHNSQSRHEGRRAKHGPFYKQDRYKAYRDFELDVWTLKGDPSTWQKQLQVYYDNNPVFALLGGISTLDWTPIEVFCETMQLPCLFPVTDRPGRNADQWYTVYFSKGLGQETEAAARYLRQQPEETRRQVIQLFSRQDNSQKMADLFTRDWERFGQTLTRSIELPDDQQRRAKLLKELAGGAQGGTTVVAWLDARGLAELAPRLDDQSTTILASYPLIEKEWESIPGNLRERLFLTYPSRLPDDRKGRFAFVSRWLKTRKIPITDHDIQSQIYFLGWMMTGVTRMMGDDFYRDYFLDVIDMMNDETYAIANVPRVSFGPGQRYASKGCFVVQLAPDEPGQLKPVTPWVIH